MFPTGVGMNRLLTVKLIKKLNVPHRRGDEPIGTELMLMNNRCSPQAWG